MSLENTKEVLVLDYFLTLRENSATNIAEKVGIPVHRVHKIINNHLKQKQK